MTPICEVPPPHIYTSLRGQTSWDVPSESRIEIALRNSLTGIYIMDADAPIAMARVIGDGAINLHIVDVVVSEGRRDQGIGRAIMRALILHLKSKYPLSATVTLMAATGQDHFYAGLGFISRPNADFGPGMIARLGDL